MKRDLLRQIVTIIGVVATILVNALANALPINGQQTGEVSDQFPVYFVPAGYVFSIWGLIYLGLIAFAIFQALPSQRENAGCEASAVSSPWRAWRTSPGSSRGTTSASRSACCSC